MEEEGIVVSASGDLARVKFRKKGACASCGICLSDGGDMLVEVGNPVSARPGQKVRVMLEPRRILKAAFIVYVFPILAPDSIRLPQPGGVKC